MMLVCKHQPVCGKHDQIKWLARFGAHQECEGLLPTIIYTSTFKGVPISFFFHMGWFNHQLALHNSVEGFLF